MVTMVQQEEDQEDQEDRQDIEADVKLYLGTLTKL